MSRFVQACRKEWSRLGVPAGAANEMAADLEADLAEAHADGASPEEVLGIGYFDAASFAASWAQARGLVDQRPSVLATVRFKSAVLVAAGLACVAAGALGLLILVGRAVGSASAAVVFRHSVPRSGPSILVTPHRFGFAGPAGPLDALGWVLLVGGLVGVGITLWAWKSWPTRPRRSGLDANVGLPSYL